MAKKSTSATRPATPAAPRPAPRPAMRPVTRTAPSRKAKAHWLEWIAMLTAFAVFAWRLIATVLGGDPTGWFWVALAILALKLVVTGMMGRSFTYFVKKWWSNFKAWREERLAEEDFDDFEDYEDYEDYEGDDGDDGDDPYLVNLDDPFPPKPDDRLLSDPSANAWTLIKLPDGSFGWGERPKLDPVELQKGFRVDPYTNTAVEELIPIPAEARCPNCGTPGIAGEFCSECGTAIPIPVPPVAAKVFCFTIGCTEQGIPGKFCTKCGRKFGT